MGYDQLCIVCGISPSPGPREPFLDPDSDCDDLSEEIATAIVSGNPSPSFDYAEVFQIVREALLQTTDHEWMPEGLSSWSGFSTCIALGFFDDEDGAAALLPDEMGRKVRFPSGLKVQTRRVCSDSGGGFMGLLEPGQSTKDALDVSTHCTSWDTLNPNFFVSEGCYRYLEAWVGIDGLPLRNAHVPHTRGLSFAGELYEIVNSRMEQRDRSHGLLPCIDYGDLADSCEQYQDVFPPRRKGFVHIARGIAQGLRGRGLLTDVMLDFNCWMFMRPDRWPYPPKVDEQERLRASTFGDFTPTTDSRGPLFARLSSEELLMICCQCTVSSYLALAATSKSFHMRLTAPEFLDLTMKEMIARGSLRWIMPVESMPGEVERAVDAAKAWLSFDSEPDVGSQQDDRELEEQGNLDSETGEIQPHEDDGEGQLADDAPSTDEDEAPTDRDTSVFSASAFPAFKFVYACFQSDSMRNRQRIWGQAKQYELLWKDFRSKGWEVNRF